MSYHVAILRTEGGRAIPITKEEVLKLAAAFPAWRYDEDQDALVSLEGAEAPALWFSDGELWTKNPSRETLEAMLQFAKYIRGRVRGDELETYRTPTESYLHPDDATAKAESDAYGQALVRRMRIKQWTFNALLLGGFVAVILFLKRMGFLE